MRSPVEAVTNCKKIRGLVSTVGRHDYDEATGQSTGPDYHLVMESLFVEILDDEVNRYIDVSDKYRKDPALFQHCENILVEKHKGGK